MKNLFFTQKKLKTQDLELSIKTSVGLSTEFWLKASGFIRLEKIVYPTAVTARVSGA